MSIDIFYPRRSGYDGRFRHSRWIWVFLVAGFLVLSSQAESILAHETWANGTPVPPWVKSWCCSVADAHKLSLGQIRRVDGGWSVEGFAHIVPDDRVSPSPDESVWIFYQTHPNGVQSEVFCFFIPESSV